MTRHQGAYPPNWKAIATAVKDEAGWVCVRCRHPHDPSTHHTLTVHHLNKDKGDCAWFNLVALCQRCHLKVQARIDMDRPWVMFEHSEWFKPFVGGHYARKYLGVHLTRIEVEAQLPELLVLEERHVLRMLADVGIAPRSEAA